MLSGFTLLEIFAFQFVHNIRYRAGKAFSGQRTRDNLLRLDHQQYVQSQDSKLTLLHMITNLEQVFNLQFSLVLLSNLTKRYPESIYHSDEYMTNLKFVNLVS